MGKIKRTMGIVGSGRIGTRCAYTASVSGLVDEVIFYDVDEKRAVSEASDLGDAVANLPHRVDVYNGGYDDLARCDVIALTAGIVAITTDRLSLLAGNGEIADGMTTELARRGYNGFVAVMTNPCDVLAWRVARHLDLPRGKVFSTGTALDTARLRKQLAAVTGLDHRSIGAMVMGEHGESQVIPWSLVNVAGAPLESLGYTLDKEDLATKTRNGAWVAAIGKGVAEYGVAAALTRTLQAIFHDEKAVLPVSAELCGEYGVEDIFAGVPCVMGENGVEKVLELPLAPQELEAFRASCETMKKAAAGLPL